MELIVEQAEAISEATTESVDPRYADLDLLSTQQIVSAMNQAEMEVPRAIEEAIPQITAAIDAPADRARSANSSCAPSSGELPPDPERMGCINRACSPFFDRSNMGQVWGRKDGLQRVRGFSLQILPLPPL